MTAIEKFTIHFFPTEPVSEITGQMPGLRTQIVTEPLLLDAIQILNELITDGACS